MDKTIGPAARSVRFLLIAPATAGMILWGVRGWIPGPWIVLRSLWQDLDGMWTNHEIWLGGRWRTPGWRFFPEAMRYVAGSWQASLTIGVALFVGGVVALWIDRLIIRWNRTPTRPM